jgi:hypothetical protein
VATHILCLDNLHTWQARLDPSLVLPGPSEEAGQVLLISVPSNSVGFLKLVVGTCSTGCSVTICLLLILLTPKSISSVAIRILLL